MTSNKKILLITDQHFGARNDNQVFLDKYQQFYSGTVIPFIKKNNIEQIICLGDTFDKRKAINFHSLDSAREMWFDPLKEMGVQMTMLIGNHDIYYKNTIKTNAPQQLLGEYDNIEILTEPCYRTFNGVRILMLPWICDDNRKKIHQMVDESDAKVCFGHLELSTFEALPGIVMDHGDDPTRYEKFDLVCSGHFHMKSKRGNINYLGNPYQLYWSDYGQRRGFHTLNTSNLRLSFHKNPHNIFNKVYYDEIRTSYDVPPDSTSLTGSFVKLIVHNRENQVWFDRYIHHLQEVGVADLKIIEDVTLELKEADEAVKMEDTVTILEQYVNDLDDSIDKPNVVKILKSLYTEAINI